MYKLNLRTDFSAAHNLRDYNGECERLHGHNYGVHIVVAGDDLGPDGMLLDFHELKKLSGEVMSELDHHYLNEVEPFDEINPTTENISKYVAGEIQQRLPDGVNVSQVTCWESDKCGVTYIPDK